MLRIFVFLCLFIPLSAVAQELPQPLSDGLNDFAQVFSPPEAARLNQTLREARHETKVHLVVVTMARIADYGAHPSERFEDYAKRLFNAWGIGDKARNDGLLLLVSTQDREMRLALGSGYEVIWDNAAQRVIDRYMLPEFRQDHYAAGVQAGVEQTYQLVVKPWLAGNPAAEISDEEDVFDLLALGVAGLLGVYGLAMILWRWWRRAARRFAACPKCGARGLDHRDHIVTQASATQAGRGITLVSCRRCDYSRSEDFHITKTDPRPQDDSGYGGGSSSGGGASGKW